MGVEAAIAGLRDQFGDRISTAEALRAEHGRDEAHLPPALPDAVAFPRSTEEVRRIVAACAAEGVAIVPWKLRL